MLLIDQSKCQYGPATESIRSLLRICDWDWNRILTHQRDSQENFDSVLNHLQQAAQLQDAKLLASASIEIIHGDWEAAGKMASESRAHGIWSNALNKAAVAAKSVAMKSDEIERWVGPPIWCFEHMLNAKNQLVIDTHMLPKFIKQERIDIAWRLMCHVEDCLYRAIVVAMINALPNSEFTTSTPNVFESLLKVYCQGIFPIEYVDGKFVVFVP